MSQLYARGLIVTPLDEDGNPYYSVDGNKITFHKTGTYSLLGIVLGTSIVAERNQLSDLVSQKDAQLRIADDLVAERERQRDEALSKVKDLEHRLATAGRAVHIQANRLQILAGHIDKSATGWTVDSVRKHLRALANDVCQVQETHGMHVNTHRDDEPVRRLAHAMTEAVNLLDRYTGVVTTYVRMETSTLSKVIDKLDGAVRTWTTEAQRRPWATAAAFDPGSPRGAVQFIYGDEDTARVDRCGHRSHEHNDGENSNGCSKCSCPHSYAEVVAQGMCGPPEDHHTDANHRCRCGKLDMQDSEGCRWHEGRAVAGGRVSAAWCATAGGCQLGDAVYMNSGTAMPDTVAEPHMSIHLQDGASTKPPLITAEQIAACAEANETVPWSLRQWALMAKKCLDAQATNLGNVHDMLRHLDGPRGQATLTNAHAIDMLRQTVGYYPDDEEAMQQEHDTAQANAIAVNHLVRSMRAAATKIQTLRLTPGHMLGAVAKDLLEDAAVWGYTGAPKPDDEDEGESDQDGLNLVGIHVPRGPITYPAPTWGTDALTVANHAGCEHLLEVHSEDDGCNVDECPCEATASGLREWLDSGHADLMPGTPRSAQPTEAEALQEPREGTPIAKKFGEVVAVLEDAARAMRAVQVRLEPDDRARLGLALARVQKLLGR